MSVLEQARRFDRCPASMRALAQWVLWRNEEREGRRTKVPYTPGTDRRASSTDPATWRPYDVAVRAFRRGSFDGIAFVCADDGLIFVDLDHCRDPRSGQIAEWAKQIVLELGTYAEVSPSGTGVHLFARGELAGDWHRRGDVEIYWNARTAAMTGLRLAGLPDEPQVVNGPLHALYASIAPPPRSAALIPEIHGSGNQLADAEVIEKATASRTGLKFTQLMGGDTFGYGEDQSAADLALCAILAFWCGNDTAQIDRIFRTSGLMRQKWDSRRGNTTYGRQTIERALGPEVYNPLIPEIQGSGPAPPDPRNTGIRNVPGETHILIPEIQGSGTQEAVALRAEIEQLRADRDELAIKLANAQALLDRFEIEGVAQAVRTEQLRADRQEAAHKELVAILENPDLTFRQRVVVALAKEMARAYVARPRFGDEAEIPVPVVVRMGELEARAGISPGTAAQSIKPAAALGLIAREEVRRDVTRPDGAHEIRTEVLIGPGDGRTAVSWLDRRRQREAERQMRVRAERRSKEEQLSARLDELEQASARAEQGCTCGGRLLPTGYFCAHCNSIASPAVVLEFPPAILEGELGARPTVLIPEKFELITRSNSSVYFADQGPPLCPDGDF